MAKISLDDFVKNYQGKHVDFDNHFGCQCMDLVEFYNRDVIGGRQFDCNAAVAWESHDRTKYAQIPYKQGLFPQKGDVVVWHKGGDISSAGHIAIALDATAESFHSFDQNWSVSPKHDPCEIVLHKNYDHVTGWLRPLENKSLPTQVPTTQHQQQSPAVSQAHVNQHTGIQILEHFPMPVSMHVDNKVSIRIMPTTESGTVGAYEIGTTFNATAICQGTAPAGTTESRWYQTESGRYVWSGCVSPQHHERTLLA